MTTVTCTVCKSGLGVRSGIETAREGGQSIRSIARDYERSGLSESAVRRHLTQGHAQRSRMTTPTDLDDAGLSPADAVGTLARGIRAMSEIRDAARTAGNHATAIRAQGEVRAGNEALGKLHVIDAEWLSDRAAQLDKFMNAERALAAFNPDDTERHGRALVAANQTAYGNDLIALADATRERITKEKK